MSGKPSLRVLLLLELCAFSSALNEPVEALDGRRPVVRPLPHVAVLRDEFTQLFDDEYDEEEEEAEARGEHTLTEKFSEYFAVTNDGCFAHVCVASVLPVSEFQNMNAYMWLAVPKLVSHDPSVEPASGHSPLRGVALL